MFSKKFLIFSLYEIKSFYSELQNFFKSISYINYFQNNKANNFQIKNEYIIFFRLDFYQKNYFFYFIKIQI